MPSARSILLLLLAAASLRSRKLEKSSHDTSPYLFLFKFEVKFANLSRRDPHRKNANLKNVRRDSAVAPLERAVGLVGVSASLR